MKPATLVIICGMAGAGKTTLAKQLETERNAIRFCPDQWIKAVIADETNKSELDRLREPVETLQWETAQRLLRRGVDVILENGFWSRDERNKLRDQARALGAKVELHYLDVPKEELWRRLEQRNAATGSDSFKISRDDLDLWWPWFTPPDNDELATYDLGYRLSG